MPPGILLIIVLNTAVHLLRLLIGGFHTGAGIDLGTIINARLALYPLGSPLFGPWQFLTYQFMHVDVSHLFFNMLGLFFLGVEVERELGTRRFLIFYLLCGIGAGLAHLVMSASMDPLSEASLIGASGSVFGVLTAFGMLFPDRSVYFFPFMFIPIRSWLFVLIYIGFEVMALGNMGDNVAHLAHLGGAVTGFLLIAIDSKGRVFRSHSGGSILGMFRSRPANRPVWRPQTPQNPFGGVPRPAQRQAPTVEAEYQDVSASEPHATTSGGIGSMRVISQEEIDRILDKIAARGYQDLTAEERDILFEASRRMEENR